MCECVWRRGDYDGWRFRRFETDRRSTNPTWLYLKTLWNQNFQDTSDCLDSFTQNFSKRLIPQRMFNKDGRWKKICGEANYVYVNLLASYLVFAHSFTKKWRSFNVMKFSTDSPCNQRWSLMSVMITFSRPSPKFQWHHIKWFNVSYLLDFFMRTH